MPPTRILGITLNRTVVRFLRKRLNAAHYSTTLSLLPIDENYTCEIFEATLEKNNGRMVWCDGKVDKLEDLEVYDGTIIVSKMIQWRVVE